MDPDWHVIKAYYHSDFINYIDLAVDLETDVSSIDHRKMDITAPQEWIRSVVAWGDNFG